MAFDRRDAPAASRAEIRLGEAALFLDLDGTLAALETTPDAVAADPARTHLLKRACAALDGRMAIVSGRSLSEIDRVVEAVSPCAAGQHGLERRGPGGTLSAAEPHPGLAGAVAALRRFAADRPGTLVEAKGLGAALHYRQAPDAAEDALSLARNLAATTGLLIQPGNRVVELRTPGPHKGDAVRAFMAEAPFAGFRPIFVGDDLTDEAAFEAVQSRGGEGILVGPARSTRARGTLAGVTAVLEWLDRSLRSGVFEVEYGAWAD